MTDRTDNFNRTNGAIGNPSDGGSAWNELAGTDWVVETSTAAYDNNIAPSPSYAVLEASVTATVAKATVAVVPSSPNAIWGLSFRVINSTNVWRTFYRVATGVLDLQKVVAGASTGIGSTAITLSAADTISIEGDASNNIVVKHNTTTIHSTADAANSSGTLHGFFGQWGSGPEPGRWDDFSITAPGGGGGGGPIRLHFYTNLDGIGSGGQFLGNRLQ